MHLRGHGAAGRATTPVMLVLALEGGPQKITILHSNLKRDLWERKSAEINLVHAVAGKSINVAVLMKI